VQLGNARACVRSAGVDGGSRSARTRCVPPLGGAGSVGLKTRCRGGDARRDAPATEPTPQVGEVLALSPCSLAGRRGRGARRERTGAMPCTGGGTPACHGSGPLKSRQTTAIQHDRPAEQATSRWMVGLRLPRSTGFGSVSCPLAARTLTESIAHCERSHSFRPSSQCSGWNAARNFNAQLVVGCARFAGS
jgi:hypothetical protein